MFIICIDIILKVVPLLVEVLFTETQFYLFSLARIAEKANSVTPPLKNLQTVQAMARPV